MSKSDDDLRATWLDNLITAGAVLTVLGGLAATAWVVLIRSPVDSDQIGYRGVAMEQNVFAKEAPRIAAANQAPEQVYELEPDDGTSERAYEIYENVQVLGHLSDDNFNRVMAQITEWVSPEQGCAYCHGEDGNFASDDNYAKVVSRRMIQMTQDINANWGDHVGGAGVNCYTCHRGMNVPANLWFADPNTEVVDGNGFALGRSNGQNHPVEANGYTDLNTDPFSAYILRDEPARVAVQVPITTEEGASLQRTEHTYSFMIHMSRALGVNCTYCHNSRAFSNWAESPPQRGTAWHGIQMARHLNVEYLDPLQPVYPENRLGPLGDAPKANCATCHNGVFKPLYGADMISDYPSLAKPGPAEMQDPAATN